jgi:hypothetical protein
MVADRFDRSPTPDAAFAARPRLLKLRDALARAAKRLRPARWGEPAVFFFDRKRQAELEAARSAPPDRFAELAALVGAELSALVASVEVRRIARTIDGLSAAALVMAPHCRTAKELAELLAVPDDEVFLALFPAERTGVRLHLRGVADVAQLYRFLQRGTPLRLFSPTALRPDGTLPAGFAGCAHWLWPTHPLAAVPRKSGERVVLVGAATVSVALDVEPRFPALVAECEVVQTLTPFQVAEHLSQLCGYPTPVQPAPEVPAVARAA